MRCLLNWGKSNQNNPFEYWQEHFDNPRYVISSICFVRNLAQYCNFNQDFLKLTSLLHIKPDTNSIMFQELTAVYQKILNTPTIQLPNPNSQVLQTIYNAADTIDAEPDETAELGSKIVLSMAIRLKAEEFMIAKIADKPTTDAITKDQTIHLIKIYHSKFPAETATIKLLKEVNLMTPENIHLNSFMYEPILDMSPTQLKNLYRKLKTI